MRTPAASDDGLECLHSWIAQPGARRHAGPKGGKSGQLTAIDIEADRRPSSPEA
jgi:hypothetical protein